MKNLIMTAILTLALIVLFSSLDYRPSEPGERNGIGFREKGGSGWIVPGHGDRMANGVPEAEATETRPEHITAEEAAAPEYMQAEDTEKEKCEMNEMWIAFWHGVAAMLVGEVSTLFAVFVWTKIRSK